MPKIAKALSDVAVRKLTAPGLHAVGGVPGLLLQVSETGARSWVLRTMSRGKRREIGLGSYPTVGLGDARDAARRAKLEIRDGGDPVERKRQARAEARKRLTFKKATERFLEVKLAELSNGKHKQQWENTIETYTIPFIGEMSVDDITIHDIQRVLTPIWTTKTETASRLRQRIEAILDWATVNGHRTGDNPARWRGNLEAVLPKPSKVAGRKNFPAVQLKDASAWFAALRKRDGISGRALEFLTLTAARSEPVRKAEWSEIDLEAKLWIVPAAHMKGKKEHRVPLPNAAVALLRAVPKMDGSPYVFPAPRGGPLTDAALSAVMKKMHVAEVEAGRPGWLDRQSGRPAVPHGLRSTFRDYMAERTDYPHEMAEIALAHTVGNRVEAAYRRGDMMEKRRAMMEDWAKFLSGKKK